MASDKTVKILLVDDKRENLLSLQVILAGMGYEFVEATSGKEALRFLLKSQDFAIILMDVQMPIMDGFETAEMIRESERLKHVPIIFLTANMNTTEYIFKGYQAGAVDYMIKPLSPEILKAKVIVFAELYKKNHELQQKEEELKALNTAIMLSNRELAQQNLEIEKHANDLRMANKELETFTYVSSHDLQEPLRKIQTFMTILLEEEQQNMSERGQRNCQRVWNAAERMRQLIESLLAFSHTNVMERKFELTNLQTIIDDVKNELQETIVTKNATVEAEQLCSAMIIPFQFTQLMQNLISNALKFAKNDVPSHITIKSRITTGAECKHEKLQPDGKYCHISIEDNGIGFDSNFNERIFEVFQRLHSKDKYEGTGIGLSIVKKIVENHNGFVTASGELMKGAKFNIYIPN
ncbi:MAG TPA: response regulator [Flavobacterium sp.]|jgi:light-regulated signal transduction histidine kinase (bacteriophytochrome)